MPATVDGGVRVAAVTLGCKLNYAESCSLLEGLRLQGWSVVSSADEADLVIVHTCAVTREAERKCRQKIRGIVRRNAEVRIAAIGCYAQLSPSVLASISGVAAVLGSGEKFDLQRYVEVVSAPPHTAPIVHASPVSLLHEAHPGASLPSGSEGARTRAFLKVQDGCDHGCAYCTIPLARGRSRSLPPDNILQQARSLAASGYGEIVLTGVNTGDYRYDGYRLADLLAMLEEVPVPRIRISSLEPDLLDQGLLDVIASSCRIVPHFHLPLQSGSDRVLKSMRRRYDTASYRERLLMVVERIGNCAVGADVMVGHPGEDAADFDAMYRFIEELPLAYLHVFSFSLRPGTVLAQRVARAPELLVAPAELARRRELLGSLGHQMERCYASGFEGRECRVLFESCQPLQDGSWACSGYTRNYLRVRVCSKDGPLAGTERPVMLGRLGEDLYFHGRLLS